MKKFNIGLLASAGVIAIATTASAATPSWSGATGSWFTGSNWSGAAVPGAGDSVTVGNGGTAQIDGARATASLSSLSISGATTVVDVQGGGSLTATSIFVGGVGTGNTGTLLLSGSTNVTGAITLANATLDDRVAGTMTNAFTVSNIGGTISTVSGSPLVLSGTIGGTGALIAAGTGQLTLTANETYTGGTTINSGATLQLGNGGTTGSTLSNINDNGLLILNHSSGFSISGSIFGTGGLNSLGSNTLASNNSYTGATQILSGTLSLTTGAISSSSGVALSGANNASLDISGTSGTSIKALFTCTGCTSGDATPVAGGSVVLGASSLTITAATGTYMGVISGTGGISIQGGSQILTGNNTFTGSTNISSGATLQLGNGGTTGSVGSSNIGDSGTLILNHSSATISGAIGGTGGALNSLGNNTLTANNTYSGLTQILSGTLALSGSGSISNSSAISLSGANSASLDISGISLTSASVKSLFTCTGCTTGDTSPVAGGSVVLGAKTLIITAASGTYMGVISGTGSVTLSAGTGNQILTGANTYSGVTTIGSSATLQIGNGGSTGKIGTGNISDSGTLIFNSKGNQAVSGTVTGTGSVSFLAGTVTYNNNTTYTGGTTIAAGATLQLLGAGTLATTGATTNGGAISSIGNISDNGALVINAVTSTLATSSSKVVTVNTGIISGTGTIEVATGSLSLNATNTVSGAVTIDSGATLTLNNNGRLPGNILDNGTLTLNSSGSTYTLSNLVSGTGGLRASGVDTLTAADTYSGTTVVTPGTVALSGAGSIVNSSVQLSGGFGAGFDISAISAAGTSIVSLASCTGCTPSDTTPQPGSTVTLGSKTLTLTNAADTFLGSINGTGALVIAGGTEILAGASTYTGGTTINAGAALQLGTGAAAGGIVGDVVNNGTLIVNRSDNINVGSVASGSGALVQAGSGVLAFTGAETYTGGTTISAGTLQIGAGGTTGSIAGDVVDNATLAFNHSDNIVFAGNVSGTGGISQLGSGDVALTGNVTTTGPTLISAGALVIGAGGTSGSLAGDVTNNSFLVFNHSDNITFAGAISGSGGVSQEGTGTVILTGANSYGGGTTINSGATLQVGAGGTAGALPGDVVNNGILVISHSDDLSYGGVVSGTGTVMQKGPDNLTVTGANTYTGATTVAAGTFSVTGSIVSSTTVQSGATLTGTGTAGAVTVQSGGTFAGTLTAGATTVQSGGILSSTGKLGATTVQSGGILTAGGAGATGTLNVGNLTLNSGSIFNADVAASGADKVVASGTASINGILNVGFATTGTFGTTQYTLVSSTGLLSGTFSGVNITNVPVNFSSSLSYDAHDVFLNLAVLSSSGTASIDSGTTTISGSQITGGLSSTGSGGTVSVSSGSTLTDNQSSNTTFSGTIAGSGAVTKTGTGTLILDGTNTYTGGTAVTGGTLEVGDAANPGASISGPVNVGSGGTLQGHGTINGPVTIGSGGNFNPGGSIGTTTVSSVTFASGSTYTVETNGAGQSDLIKATGAASISTGAKLAVTEDAPLTSFARTTTYTILQASGGVTGTFGTLTSASPGFLPSVTYGATTVSLTLQRTDLLTGLASSTNSANAAAAVLAGGASALSTPLAAMSDAGVSAAFSQLTGDIHASLRSAAVEDSRVIRDAILDHLNTPAAGTGIWGMGFGGYGSIGTNGNASGLHHDSAGFLGGADLDVGDGFRLGAGGAYSSNNASINGHASTARGNSGHFLGYAGWSDGTVNLRLGGDLGWGSTNVSRTVAAYSETDIGSQDQRLGQVFGEMGYHIPGTPLEPYVGVASISATTGAFSETGGSGALSGAAKTDTQSYSTVGLRVAAPIPGTDWLALRINVGWQHSFSSFVPTQSQTLQSLSQSFTVMGAPLARDAVAMRMGFAAAIAPDASLSLDYDGSAAGHVQNNAVRGGLEWRF